MKNRFSRMGTSLLGAMCLLSTCGLTYSCSDDYDLDETMPSFLGGSIYDELKARNFNTVIKLIDDLEYADVLSRTGSKTLFVADDEAYAKFFATTSWLDANGNPVRSYEQLTEGQKKLLLYGAMLNNADVLEMLPYSSTGTNLTMRRETAASAVDSVPFWNWYDLPDNLNVASTDEEGNAQGDKRFWDRFRNQAQGGIYMALDATNPMLTHFIEENLKVQDITHDDISFIHNNKNPWLNGSAGGKRAYVYDAQILPTGTDITCLNGYINILDTVMVTPPNMAEVIRTNGSTNLFSRMLDRFSAPYYNSTLTANYKMLHDIGNDSVFEKRYISTRSAGNAQITLDPDNKSLGDYPLLSYDPGWNQYQANRNTAKEQDMAAMFVPSDDAMREYFINGGGRVLMERYATLENTAENLEYNLYQIPQDIIQALINNLMKDSFIESVPSKYLTIMNDARDQMFAASNSDYATLEKYKQCFDRVLMANNGVVYVMNRVISPADYASVIAPALYQSNTRVIRSVVRADDNYIEGTNYANAPLQKYYSTYLKAMQSHFSFFVPTDDGLGSYGYVDPMSIARGTAQNSYFRYWRFNYQNISGAIIPVRSYAYAYSVQTGQQPETDRTGLVSPRESRANDNISDSSTSKPGKVKRTLLIDMLDQHIVVHNTGSSTEDALGVNSSRQYFISRGGAPVYVASKGDVSNNGVGMVVDGGYQLQLKSDAYDGNEHDCVVTDGYDMTAESNGYGNGMTYLIDRPMQPTTNSTYRVMNNTDEYKAFFTLCNESEFTADELEKAGFRTDAMNQNTTASATLWSSEQKKYRIFQDMDGNYYPAYGERLVRFFNNYRYTIYVPTEAALQQAYANGLKTHDEIIAYMDNIDIAEANGDTEKADEYRANSQAMIITLINFLKYHFQDESLFVDHVSSETTNYQTSCIDNVNNIYLSTYVSQSDGTITVTDRQGNTQNVVAPYNMLARDASYDVNPREVATKMTNSSFVVMHQINQALNFKDASEGASYSAAWNSPAKAKAFVKKYSLR